MPAPARPAPTSQGRCVAARARALHRISTARVAGGRRSMTPLTSPLLCEASCVSSCALPGGAGACLLEGNCLSLPSRGLRHGRRRHRHALHPRAGGVSGRGALKVVICFVFTFVRRCVMGETGRPAMRSRRRPCSPTRCGGTPAHAAGAARRGGSSAGCARCSVKWLRGCAPGCAAPTRTLPRARWAAPSRRRPPTAPARA